MKSLPDKRFYKVISLFIKAMILIFSFLYIWKKINEAHRTVDLGEVITKVDAATFLIVFLLMICNWSIEAVKWKILIRPLEQVSFLRSLKSVLCGVIISIFTPNRMGEFAGRIFFLEKADKVEASLSSMIGSVAQLLVTVIAGIFSYYILEHNYYGFFDSKPFITPYFFPLLAMCFAALIALSAFIYLKRNTLFLRFKKYILVVNNYSNDQLSVIFFLSVLRYAVFSFQYFLILRMFGINAGSTILFCLIALVFFVTSAIPTFALTEIAVRGATATFFFSTVSLDSNAIIAASLLLWIINLIIPGLVGSIYIWKLKFFTSDGI